MCWMVFWLDSGNAGEEIGQFDTDYPAALPSTSELVQASHEWIASRGIGRANFYSAREEPEAPVPKGAEQVQALAALQTAATPKAEVTYSPSVAPALGPSGGPAPELATRMRPLSHSLAALPAPKVGFAKTPAGLLGPPPKTKKPSPLNLLPPEEPVNPLAQESTDPMLSALAQQSSAITTLVARLAGQAGDPLTDLQSGAGGISSSSTTRGLSLIHI